MPFQKGIVTNPKGRVQGSHNKISHNVRSMIAQLVNNNLSQMQTDIDALEPKERLDVMLKLMRYVIPTLTSVSFDEDTQKTATEHLQALATWSDHATHQNNIN